MNPCTMGWAVWEYYMLAWFQDKADAEVFAEAVRQRKKAEHEAFVARHGGPSVPFEPFPLAVVPAALSGRVVAHASTGASPEYPRI